MKKKIFIASLMVAILICLFAITTAAAECIDGIYYDLSGTEAAVSTSNASGCQLANVVIPEKVTFNGVEYTVTSIKEKAFGSATASKGNGKVVSVTIPSTVTIVGQYAFANCVNITTVNSYSTILGSYMFYNCPLVENVTLKNTVKISNHAFCNTIADNNSKKTNISSLVFPETLQFIGQYAFARCLITNIVIPAGVTTIEGNAFTDCDSLEKAVVLGTTLNTAVFNNCSALDELVLTEKIAYGHKDAIKDTVKNFTTYYTGSDPSVIKTLFAGTSRVDSAVAQPYNAEGNYTGSCKIIYGVNLCVAAFDSVHTEPKDDANCETAVVCSMCNGHTFKAAKTHVNAESITYASFIANGLYTVGCTNDGCSVGTKEEVKPLFGFSGVSTPIDGRGVMTVGYSVNYDEIARYESITNTTISYGVFAVLKDKLGSNDILDASGNPISGAIKAEISREYASFDLKISGFETKDHKALKLALGAYVIDNTGKIFYMQEGIPQEGEKYVFVSYSDVATAPNN